MRPEQLMMPEVKQYGDNIENTLRFLRDNCPPEGYLVSFSGGKDSLAVLECCKEAKVPYRYYMKITTVDPPELTKYVKRCHPECVRLPPIHGKSLYEMIKIYGLPTRRGRWCCGEFKEYVHPMERGQHILIGVRWEESDQRRNWPVKTCMQTGGYKIAPILAWTEGEVWDFIKARGAEYCELYSEGFKRIGCIGCPLPSSGKIEELLRWPWAYCKYREAARESLRRKKEKRGYIPAYVWPGWMSAKALLKDMKAMGATKQELNTQDMQLRAEALRWQDAQDPEYLMRRVMAWWLECPVDYWKLDELERYAASKTIVGAGDEN
jgi:phosphoadenosine phosphosulfate reductase